MQIFIMRHGQAEQVAQTDQQRELTAQGFIEVQAIAQFMKDSGVVFEQIFVSPFVRAQQTANTMVRIHEYSDDCTTLPFITPSGSAKELHDYLDGFCSDKQLSNILIVSHMPLVSYVVAELTNDHQSPIFQTAAIAEIDYDLEKMQGNLVQVISPSELKSA